MRGRWFVNEGRDGIATVKFINDVTEQVQSLCRDVNGNSALYLERVLCDAQPGDIIAYKGRTVAHVQYQPLGVQ